ncbi:MAG: 6-phosphofructokinase, partial [Lachnospiraceae bacterium]|nr:6-phosphofructokinase [Lachnospiraceae bacterium]
MSILDEKKRVAIVGQSGGPTVAINASLAGVIGEARKAGFSKVYGMVNGISGFLEGRTVDLFDRFPGEKSLDDLAHTPSMYLGSCRHKLPEVSDTAFYKDLVDKLNKLGVTDFFYIGGNDSMDTVAKLSAYGEQSTCPIRFIGIPKT